MCVKNCLGMGCRGGGEDGSFSFLWSGMEGGGGQPGKIGGRRHNFLGGGNKEKLGKILQHCKIFCNKNETKR